MDSLKLPAVVVVVLALCLAAWPRAGVMVADDAAAPAAQPAPPTRPTGVPASQSAGEAGSQPAGEPTSEPEIAKELVLELGGKARMRLALIPAGSFMMGSPEYEKGRVANEDPQHEVEISKPFYMGIYEVTQAQYEAVVSKNPSSFQDASKPVEGVTWDDAVEFCKKVSGKTGRVVRLPSEAEWEYACRAGTGTAYYCGDTPAEMAKCGWCNRSEKFAKTTKVVGSFPGNLFGLYDTHGNVWEWCADWYGQDYYSKSPKTDPQGPDAGKARVLRGGCYNNDPTYCRSAFRLWSNPSFRQESIGFRVVTGAP